MVFPELKAFVSAQKAKGLNDSEIRASLSSAGWSQDNIDEAGSSQFSQTPPSTGDAKPFGVVGEIQTPTVPDKPRVKGGSKLKALLLFLVVLFLLGAASVYGYFFVYLAPERVVARSVAAMEKVDKVEFDGRINVAIDPGSVSSPSPGEELFPTDMLRNFTVDFIGRSDASNPESPLGQLTVEVQAAGMSLFEAEVRAFDEVFYFNLLNIIDLGLGDMKSLQNQWVRVSLAELAASSYLESDYPTYELTPDEEKELLDFVNANPPFVVTERLQGQEINGAATFHYKYRVEKENLIKVLKKISELSGQPVEDSDYTEVFKDVSFEDGEIWIGKRDLYIYKTKFTVISSDPTTDAKATLGVDMNFKNYNNTPKIEEPTDTKSFEEFFGTLAPPVEDLPEDPLPDLETNFPPGTIPEDINVESLFEVFEMNSFLPA